MIENIINKIFTLLHISIDEKKLLAITQFIKFGLVGASNVAVSYFLNIGTLLVLGPYNFSWDYVAGNTVAFLLSVLWSFYWNNRYVFQTQDNEKRNLWKVLLKTYIAYSFSCIVLNNVLSYLWIDVLGISKYIAPLINLIVTVPVNFVLNKVWAFRSEKERKE